MARRQEATLDSLTDLPQFERHARESVHPETWRYFERGVGRELSLAENLESFRRWRFRPRVMIDVSEVSTAVELLGTRLALPVLVAPFASQRLLDRAGEVATARAAAAAATAICVSTGTNTRFGAIAAAAPSGVRWLQLYVMRDRGRTREVIAEAVEAGFSAILVTADTPYPAHGGGPAVAAGTIEPGARIPAGIEVPYMTSGEGEDPDGLRVSPALTWPDVQWLAGESGLPVLVKGILSPEDAVLACEHGAAGVVVSNHGGRQLDEAIAPLDALGEIADAVGGRGAVLMDGGVRSGNDVLKALALGAAAVLVGRPIAAGLAVAGEAGVARVLELLHRELALGLALLGCPTPAQVTRAHLTRV